MNKIKRFENFTNTSSDPNPSSRDQKSIFVSIVSYRDPDIISTLISLIKNAKRPENIFVSLVVSVIGNHESWASSIMPLAEENGLNLAISVVEAGDNHKLGELKDMADSLYNKEDYYLSINSCTEFDPHWDDILIKQYDSFLSITSEKNIIFTADPRSFIPSEDVIDGYRFFTNHKTRISFQREEYDGSRIPISGLSPLLKEERLYEKGDNNKEGASKYIENLAFFKENGFPKFSNREFSKDEVFAPSLGFSSKFIFSSAKEYLKNISETKVAIAEDDFNFIAFVTLIEKGFSIISPRWVPMYHLYERKGAFPVTRKSPLDFYEDKDLLKDTDSYKFIEKTVSRLQDDENFKARDSLNRMLALDFKNREFKVRKYFVVDLACEFANLAVSAYNFSTNENTLHWNKRDI